MNTEQQYKDSLCRKNPFTDTKTYKGVYITKQRKREIERYNNGDCNDKEQKNVEELMRLYELSRMKDPIEQQFAELRRNYGKGVLQYSHKGVNYYDAKKIILIGSSGSGKSTNILNLLVEAPVAYEAVHVICPETTINNEVYTTLRFYCNKAGIKFYWTNSDNEDFVPQFGDADKKEKNGSSKFIHDNKLGMFLIFDDTYSGNKHNWVSQLMSDAFIKLRHRLINTIVCLQSPNYMLSTVALNYSHLFISGDFLSRDGIWNKFKLAVPDNLPEMISDYNNTHDKRHQFYYIKAGDSFIHKYIPYQFHHRSQIIKKFQSKLPKGIEEAIDIGKVRDAQKEQEEGDITVTDQSSYEQRESNKIKNRPDTMIKSLNEDIQENKKKKYYYFNGFRITK